MLGYYMVCQTSTIFETVLVLVEFICPKFIYPIWFLTLAQPGSEVRVVTGGLGTEVPQWGLEAEPRWESRARNQIYTE